MVKPKLIMERAVRTHAMRVRSAASLLRSSARMSISLSSGCGMMFAVYRFQTPTGSATSATFDFMSMSEHGA